MSFPGRAPNLPDMASPGTYLSEADIAAGSGALIAVSHDGTLSGDGTSGSPLSVLSAPGGFEMKLLQGSGAGDYVNATTTMSDVDGTNLKATVTVPVGETLLVIGVANCGSAGNAGTELGISVDSAAPAQNMRQYNGNAPNLYGCQVVYGIVVGDGAAHTVSLAFSTTTAGAGTQAIIRNSIYQTPPGIVEKPYMVLFLGNTF